MDVVSDNYIPGDPRLIDQIVYELKSQGIFDNFRKECIADVDTKPAYQNLRQRVEGSVLSFLKSQKWRPDMNKNYIREMLRKNIYESGFLEIGVERIVDQVVNPKINSIFLPKVEDIIYNYYGIQKPFRNGTLSYTNENLLPNDLEAVSPDSEVLDKNSVKLDKSMDSDKLDDSKIDEDESPPFEPIEVQNTYMQPDESSMDSHLSGISGLVSHDSNSNNNETQMSKLSSESRLSIVTSPDEVKMDISEDSTQMSKSSKNGIDSVKQCFNFNFNGPDAEKNKSMEDKKLDEKKSEDKKHSRKDSDRSKRRHSDFKDRKDEKKSDRDRKDKHSNSSSSKDRDKDKSSGSSSKDKYKDSKSKESSSSKSKSSSSGSGSSKHKSNSGSGSSRKDSTNDKAKSETKDRTKSKTSTSSNKPSSKEAASKSTKSESKSKLTKDDKGRSKSDRPEKKSNEKRDNKKEQGKKDDHYGWKTKKTTRRSADRDSNDGHSGLGTNSSSSLPTTESSGSVKTNNVEISSSNSRESGNSDRITIITDQVSQDNKEILITPEQIQPIKLIKPRFASNIFEAKRLMKIRKKMERIQQKMQQRYVAAVSQTVMNTADSGGETATVVDVAEPTPRGSVISKESWDAIEAKVNQENVLNVDYNSYSDAEGKMPLVDCPSSPGQLSNQNNASASAEPQDTAKIAESSEPSPRRTIVDAAATPQSSKLTMSSKSSEDGEDVKYFSPKTSPKTERFLAQIVDIQQQTMNVIKSRRARKPNMRYCSGDFAADVSFSANKVAIVEMSTPGGGGSGGDGKNVGKRTLKRKAENETESDVDNNNKKAASKPEAADVSHPMKKEKRQSVPEKDPKAQTAISNEQNTSTSSTESIGVDAPNKIKPISKLRKSKRLDSSVHIDSFPMPLSPAESDVSASSLDMKRVAEEAEASKTPKPAARGQRYSSDDLYKPRPSFLGSRRSRAARGLEKSAADSNL